MYTITVNLISSTITPQLDPQTAFALDVAMRFRRTGYQHSLAYKRRQWDGYTHLLTKRQVFPSGLLYIVEDILKQRQIVYTVVDQRTKIFSNDNPLKLQGVTLRDYQEQIVKTCLNNPQLIVRAPMGAGKTLCIAGLVAHLHHLPIAIYQRRLLLMNQTKEMLEECLPIEVGRIGGGILDIKQVNVIMIPTAVRAFGQKFVRYWETDEDDSCDYSDSQFKPFVN